ncbi:MAG: response regulator [Candidatus Heimdallarchaeota archaeon]|nr:response regulator [Candidatus Heimdallarchaeota archaeon]
MLKKLLLKNNFTNIVELVDGNQLCTTIEKEKPDVIFLDIILPTKNGIELLENFMKVKKHEKIFIISGMGHEPIVNKAMSLGADGFIIKPIDESKLKPILDDININ